MFFRRAYSVYVDDNFHYMDESERYHLGDFANHAAAVAACKKMVDDYLASAYKPGMTIGELLGSDTSFGDDPWIKPKLCDSSPPFSARDYASRRYLWHPASAQHGLTRDEGTLQEEVRNPDRVRAAGRAHVLPPWKGRPPRMLPREMHPDHAGV